MIRRVTAAAWIALGLGLIAIPIVTVSPGEGVCADEVCRSTATTLSSAILL